MRPTLGRGGPPPRAGGGRAAGCGTAPRRWSVPAAHSGGHGAGEAAELPGVWGLLVSQRKKMQWVPSTSRGFPGLFQKMDFSAENGGKAVAVGLYVLHLVRPTTAQANSRLSGARHGRRRKVDPQGINDEPDDLARGAGEVGAGAGCGPAKNNLWCTSPSPPPPQSRDTHY